MQGSSLLGVSFTCVSQASCGAALAVGAADVVALALGAAKSPSPAATQSSTTHERGCRNVIRCDIRPSPSDKLDRSLPGPCLGAQLRTPPQRSPFATARRQSQRG